MCGTVFRNRGSDFPEQISPFFGGITARFSPSKSVCESRCLIEQGWGYPFRRTKNADPYPVFGWATLPPNGIFDLKDGSCGGLRQNEKNTDRRSITTKAARSSTLGTSRRFLFPIFQRFIQRHIQCRPHTFLQNCHDLRFNYGFLFLLFVFVLAWCHFSFTSLLIFTSSTIVRSS